jgi:hypothetical protein
MKSGLAMIALAGALASQMSAASGAASNISGTYLMNVTTLCQAIQNEVFTTTVGSTDQDQQTTIQSIDPGSINQQTGYITFTPSAAGSNTGTVSAVLAKSQGSLLILGLPGPPAFPDTPDMTFSADKASSPESGTYTMAPGAGLNPGTLTISLGGGSLSFTAFFGGAAAGIYHQAQFIAAQTNGKGCTTQGSATRK